MIPAYDVQFLFPGGLLRIAHIFGADRKAIVRGILAAVHQREQRQDLAERWLHTARCRSPVADGAVETQESHAAFVRIGLRAVLANFLRDFRAHLQCWSGCHGQCSSQKRSLKYFAPESANTVTITACCSRGSFFATAKQPFSAAAALGLTSKPSSRAMRFTNRYASSVPTSKFSSASVSS